MIYITQGKLKEINSSESIMRKFKYHNNNISYSFNNRREGVNEWIQCRVYRENYDNHPGVHLRCDVNTNKRQKTYNKEEFTDVNVETYNKTGVYGR
jgi:hypothetical protein